MTSAKSDETLTPEYKASIEFLDRWMPSGPWVVVAIDPNKKGIAAATFGKPTIDDLRAWLDEHGTTRKRNLYFAVNTCRRMTKKPTKADVIGLNALHVDVDPRVGEDLGTERERILALLRDPTAMGLPRPSCIVDSGGGFQAFWRLNDPVMLDAEKTADAEARNKHLEIALGGDACWNIDRIMRLPGTVNWPDARKRAKGRVPALASVVEFNDARHDRDAIERAEVSPSSSSVEPSTVTIDTANVKRFASVDDIPELRDTRYDQCRVVIVQGLDPDNAEKHPSKSEWQHFVCCEMVRAGCDDDTIYSVITDPAFGVSKTVLEKGRGAERYAVRQVERARERAGSAGGDEGGPILDPGNPRPSARLYVEHDAPHLLYYNGDWLDYGRGSYFEVEPGIVSARVFAFLERARRLWMKGVGKYEPGPYKPMRKDVGEVLSALESVTIRARDLYAPPCWIAEPGQPPREIISCANGLLHLPTGALLPASPSFFTRNALEIAYDASAPRPTSWLAFLGHIWPDDRDSIAVLQEVFGYLLMPDTSQQKVFMLIGPARSGKGTIGRVLTRLVGEANAVGSDMKSLGGNFGLQPLIGKQLAIVADMRLGRRTDPAAIAENLLRISGEDLVTADRKNKTAWTGTLAVRFVIMTNELPKFSDASGALANRFVPLVMTESFLGREDHGLTARLLVELPGILNWAIEGWRRLHDRGHFVLPGRSRDAIQDLHDMASPVSAFVRDRCALDPEGTIEKVVLYGAWREWCLARGEALDEDAIFARNLLAATRGVRPGKGPRPARAPIFVGIRLREAADDDPQATDLLG